MEEKETFLDEHGTPMTADTAITKWDDDEVREHVRENWVKPWMERRGIDTDNFFSADEEARAIIRPLRNGMGLLETPQGKILGVLPLELWAQESFKTINSEAAAQVQVNNAKSDAERRKDATVLTTADRLESTRRPPRR